MIDIGFTPPNLYRPNPNFEAALGYPMGFPPPAAYWLSDMLNYYQWTRRDGMKPEAAWKKLRMRVKNAASALDPASGKERGLIPPEIVGRVLARAQGGSLDDVAEVIVQGWPPGSHAVLLNEYNSSAPDTEHAILAEESYGRQIGKLLDAVHELIKDRPGSDSNPALRDITLLRDKVERVKRRAAASRIDQLRRDLELLKASDPAEFQKRIEGLRSVLTEADS